MGEKVQELSLGESPAQSGPSKNASGLEPTNLLPPPRQDTNPFLSSSAKAQLKMALVPIVRTVAVMDAAEAGQKMGGSVRRYIDKLRRKRVSIRDALGNPGPRDRPAQS